MGIIRKTFMFWLITGVIAALAVTLLIPKLKTKVVEKIPGRDEAMQIVERAKTAITNLPEQVKSLKSAPKVNQTVPKDIEEESLEESVEEPAPQIVQDSIKNRDEKLFKRQCAILDDLL